VKLLGWLVVKKREEGVVRRGVVVVLAVGDNRWWCCRMRWNLTLIYLWMVVVMGRGWK
jgi:hypothetical protein